MNIEKKFQEWCKKKIELEKSKKELFHPKILDIRNCYFWKNLNWEQSWDENNDFFRPVLVIKTFWYIWNIIILPLTKSKKPDFISYKILKSEYHFLKNNSYILLDKVKAISIKRLEWWKPLWKIKKSEYKKIVKKFQNLFTI